MKKIKMARGVTLTFEEGCNKYLENCRQRNLREGTIGHYTGVRQRSLMHIKAKDIVFDNCVVYVNVTKNRKPLLVPINQTIVHILTEFLKYIPQKP